MNKLARYIGTSTLSSVIGSGFKTEEHIPYFDKLIKESVQLPKIAIYQKSESIKDLLFNMSQFATQESIQIQPIREKLQSIIFNILGEEITPNPTIISYIFHHLGKMYRPSLFYLMAKTIAQNRGQPFEGEIEDRVLHFCSCIEIAHNVSLLQDDIIDQSPLRRGRRTSHSIYGVMPTVFSSNYSLSRACKHLAFDGNEYVSQIFSNMVHWLVKVV